jgi:hypothetical protein
MAAGAASGMLPGSLAASQHLQQQQRHHEEYLRYSILNNTLHGLCSLVLGIPWVIGFFGSAFDTRPHPDLPGH